MGKEAKQSAASGGSCPISWDSNSFSSETPVLLADGTRKSIVSMVVGDVVAATDPTTGETAAKEVTDVRSHVSDRELYKIWISDKSGVDSLVATDEHPFWGDSLQKWADAEDLKPGYRFLTTDNRSATVVVTQPYTDHGRRVYNLTVDGLHTCYVGVGQVDVLTHNYEKVDVECTKVTNMPGFG